MLDAIATTGLAFSSAGISLVAGFVPLPPNGAAVIGGIMVIGGLALIALATEPEPDSWHAVR